MERITARFTGLPSPDAATDRDVAEAIVRATTKKRDAFRVVLGDGACLAARMRRETLESESLHWAATPSRG